MPTEPEPEARADLFWIPLGAGGTGFVSMNGRVYEWWKARSDHRQALNLYHTALQLHGAEGHFVLETMWPSPPEDPRSRGVVFQGAVGAVWLARCPWFRYEVRRWPNGVLPDAGKAVGGPQTVTTDPEQVQRILRLAESVPDLIWGRDQKSAGEMWNSNSVIAWLLARAGLPMERIQPPPGGRAPGWDAGIAIAAAVATGRRPASF